VINTVLFDLDGTLLDTAADFTMILNELLPAHGLAPVSHERVRQVVSSGGRAMVREAFGVPEDDPVFVNFLDVFLDRYASQIENPRCELFPGIEELLRGIEDAGLRWGIVTNKNSRFTLPLLAKIPALKDCPVVICPDIAGQPKPDPAGILMACERLGSKPHESVYVGDHPRDVEAGRNAGMPTIVCEWGYLPANDPVENWQADLVVSSAPEIYNFLFHQKL
jgi:N-acetyl-D-muramate 6-phosphate phosphatase